MNKKAFKTLEYNKIINQLIDFASSDGGKELCRQLLPSTNLEEIVLNQQKTSDALSRILRGGNLSFSGVTNLGACWKRLEIGGSLNAIELLNVCKLLKVTKRAKAFSRTERDEITADTLNLMFEQLEPLTPLSDEINRCIISEDEVADDASPALKQVRRQIRVINDKVRSQLTGMLNSSIRTYLQDAVITMRNDRYCLPVKAEYRSQVSGMVHDQSSTGSTVFIEPTAIVKLNNDLKEVFLKEQTEIEAVLATLSSLVAEHVPELISNYELLTALDFIFAKAYLAESYNGSAPHFNEDHKINILKGRHPLLEKHHVVPIDLPLGKDYSQLILTGPNTGGKTVSLKTIGLFTLMGQAGLHIPASERSELSVFDNVYADIGDEQSIEQNLSTFSSHMTNIVSILNHVDENSLVLFDELCAGTDPTEGAALAISILSRLQTQKIRTIATTHYSELKVYALSTPDVENACCEFDVETLSPTYRLLIGIPGKSNAFAISKKLGLPDSIIEDARQHLNEEDETFEDLISDLETKRAQIENDQLRTARLKEEAQILQTQLDQKLSQTDDRREKIIQQAHEEALTIVKQAKDMADESIRAIHKYGSDAVSVKKLEEERTKLRQKMTESENKVSIQPKKAVPNYNAPKNLKIGDSVKVLSMNLKGTVHSLPDARGNLFVQMGILKYKVNTRDLLLLPDAEFDQKKFKNSHSSGSSRTKIAKSASVSTEINLIGKNADDAIALLDKYLDDAYLAHIPSVRIVHGKGSGVLRKAVQSHLKNQPYVKSYRIGEFGEGDAGVTIAELE